MKAKMTFKRYELKYLLDSEQKQALLDVMEQHMSLDSYGRTTIRNIYFDTDSYRLIRRSIEKPPYKEKLRVRSYGEAGDDDAVFVELKKKYDSVVYKRRLALPCRTAMERLCSGKSLGEDSQISKEIEYFCRYYKNLRPAMFLSYEREAYYALDKSDFRVTFDENILYRTYDFTFEGAEYGKPILGSNQTLMEIKTTGAIPLWMVHFLTKNNIYKTSFSKYGTAYEMETGGKKYA
ncbi:MAG: polyphosphate polymerase domain-containing protein [Ruminococcus sp.]